MKVRGGETLPLIFIERYMKLIRYCKSKKQVKSKRGMG